MHPLFHHMHIMSPYPLCISPVTVNFSPSPICMYHTSFDRELNSLSNDIIRIICHNALFLLKTAKTSKISGKPEIFLILLFFRFLTFPMILQSFLRSTTEKSQKSDFFFAYNRFFFKSTLYA